MMIGLLAVAVLGQERQALDPSFQGLWVSSQGKVLALARPRTWYLDIGTMQVTIQNVLSVPDGSMLGVWAGSDRLGSVDSGVQGRADRYIASLEQPGSSASPLVAVDKTLRSPREKRQGGGFMWPGVVTAGLPRTNFGEARVKWGPPGSNGTYNNFELTLNDSRNTLAFRDRFYYAGTEAQIAFGGTYKAQGVEISVQEEARGESATLGGTVKYLSKSYELYGARVWTRGWFQAFDTSRGTLAGYGYLVWTPSSEESRDIRLSKLVVPAKVRGYLYLTDKSLPSGAFMEMGR